MREEFSWAKAQLELEIMVKHCKELKQIIEEKDEESYKFLKMYSPVQFHEWGKMRDNG